MDKNNRFKLPRSINFQASVFQKLGYIFNLSRYVAEKENIGLVTQYSEMIFLYLTKRLGPLLYFEARLWKKDFSLKQKMRFLNSAQYKKRISELNPTIYRKFSNHKLVEKSVLSLLGIPTAKFIGFFHPFNGSDSTHKALTNLYELNQLLASHVNKKICFKLTEGWGGDGFLAIKVTKDAEQIYVTILPNILEKMTLVQFFEQYLLKNYHLGLVVEDYIEQHEILANFNKSSVNTLRMWLIQHEGNVKLIGTILRIGRKNEIVDNSSQGGILCLIDPESGKIIHGMTTGIIPQNFDSHPDSGVQLSGIQLPFWGQCVKLGKACLRTFPHTNFVGLDIAFSASGPLIVELNQEPDKVSARNFGHPLGDLLIYVSSCRK